MYIYMFSLLVLFPFPRAPLPLHFCIDIMDTYTMHRY